MKDEDKTMSAAVALRILAVRAQRIRAAKNGEKLPEQTRFGEISDEDLIKERERRRQQKRRFNT